MGPQAAVTHYERAVALDPNFCDALYNLGTVCQELGRSQDAIRHFREYTRLTQ
jgi:tetratricopeptide (TPR) repeat protein